ncbi:MAG TPA: glycosyltransferase family A protein [Solirubrobacteraceae bacterium]|jgi:rhamnosyltransferase
MADVSVVIPVRDGGDCFAELLRALARQTVEHELVICDSGSRDESVALARSHGARVIEIAPERFSHGRVRNELVQASAGSHAALLTQDALPADEHWLQRLLQGFDLAADVALVYGPYRPRVEASLAVRGELEAWFESLAPDGEPSVERLDAQERRALAPSELIGRRGFFSDANACVARAAWQRIPFRDVAYAEDRVLALDMLHAGYAKAFVPQAAVTHSHSYTTRQQLRRSFDEWRGLLEVYGWREPADPRHLASRLRGALGQARRQLDAQGAPPTQRPAALAGVTAHQLATLSGALLGSRADRLAPTIRRRLSLEGRPGYAPLSPGHAASRDGEEL